MKIADTYIWETELKNALLVCRGREGYIQVPPKVTDKHLGATQKQTHVHKDTVYTVHTRASATCDKSLILS